MKYNHKENSAAELFKLLHKLNMKNDATLTIDDRVCTWTTEVRNYTRRLSEVND